MAVKVFHIRRAFPDGTLDGKGGATVAYTSTGKEVMFQVAYCRTPSETMNGKWDSGDMFSRALGRQIAVSRLRSLGPIDVLTIDAEQTASQTIIDWLCANASSPYAGLEIEKDYKHRYVWGVDD